MKISKMIKEDNYSRVPDEIKEFNYYFEDAGNVIMAVPECLIKPNGTSSDLDMVECAIPCEYVLEKGYRMYQDHVVVDAPYDDIMGLMISEEYDTFTPPTINDKLKVEAVKGLITADKLGKDSTVHITISKNEIDLCATYRLELQIDEFKKAGKDMKNNCSIGIDGYDNDTREAYQIPEICKYFTQLYLRRPAMFYFMKIETYTLAITFNCLRISNPMQLALLDKDIADYAKSVGDNNPITVSYYMQHRNEFHKNN